MPNEVKKMKKCLINENGYIYIEMLAIIVVVIILVAVIADLGTSMSNYGESTAKVTLGSGSSL